MDDTTRRHCGNCWHSVNFTAGECPGRVQCGPYRAWEPVTAPKTEQDDTTTEDNE